MNQLIGYLSEGEQLKGSLTIPQQLGGSTLGSKTITANGVYDATDDGVDGYDVVTANVPNTYAAGDEGKVVDNGALVSQTTATYTVNNTYDTTKIKSVTVNVGGGSPTLETITKTYTPTTSQQTEQITPSSGYDGIAEVDVTVNAMPTGTLGKPLAMKGAVSNHQVEVTPVVATQAGYIATQSKSGDPVTVSASELDSGTKSITANGNNQDVVGYAAVDVAVPNSYSAADEGKVVDNGALVAQTAHADVTPTTSDQTIDTTLNNSIKVIGDSDLVASNIKKDVVLFGVTGSYEGSGGSDVVMQQIKNIGLNGLSGASIGEVVNFKSLTYIGEHGLQNLIGARILVLPKLGSTANYPVSDNANLEIIDIGATWTQASMSGSGWFFSEDRKLATLILRRPSVPSMPNVNCFNLTPFASNGAGGTLYVPSSLISSYQSASNWSTILGYANNSIVAIEGSQYENYYADGTPVT